MSALAVLIGLSIHIGIPASLLWRLCGFRADTRMFIPTTVTAAVGWNFLVAQALDVVSIPVDHRGALVADIVLATAAFAPHRRRAARSIDSPAAPLSRSPKHALAAAAVVAGVL